MIPTPFQERIACIDKAWEENNEEEFSVNSEELRRLLHEYCKEKGI